MGNILRWYKEEYTGKSIVILVLIGIGALASGAISVSVLAIHFEVSLLALHTFTASIIVLFALCVLFVRGDVRKVAVI